MSNVKQRFAIVINNGSLRFELSYITNYQTPPNTIKILY